MQRLKIDKEFQRLIPPLQETEYKQLEENVIGNGCQDAIKVWDGTIVDGHNRYKICTEHGVEFKVHDMTFSDRNAAIIWIIKNQFGRRNLLPFQRGELALVLKPLVAERAKEKQSGGQGGVLLSQKSDEANPIRTDEEIAKHAGVSRDTIRKVETIKKSGTEGQLSRARTGGKGNTVNAIYGEIVQSGQTEKTCTSCGQTLLIEKFEGRRNQCNSCRNQLSQSGGSSKKDLLNTIIAVSEQARDSGRETEYSIDSFSEEFSFVQSDYLQKVRRMLDIHFSLMQIPENRQKAIAALSEAETAIKKIKELLK